MIKPDLLAGPVGTTLFRMAVPMLFGILSIVAFNLVDTYFIGQLGADQLAALGFTFPVVSVVGSVAHGLGVGISSIVSASLGAGERERAAHETTDSLLLGLVVVILVSTVGYFTIDPLFTLLGATPANLPYIREYMEVWYVSVVFLIVPMAGNSAIRATGDTATPSYIIIASMLLNLVLDPLLIFGYGPFPELGIRGAALATALSRAFAFGLSVYVLRCQLDLLRVPRSAVAFLRRAWSVAGIAGPAGAARAINPLGIAVLTGMLATYGAAAVAGYGVGSRVELLALTFVTALSTVVGPFVGQNFGAGNGVRIRAAANASFRFCLGSGALIGLVLFAVPEYIAGWFSDAADVRSVVKIFLRTVPFAYAFLGVTLVGATVLNAVRRPWAAALLSVVQMFGLLLPLAWLGSGWNGVPGLFTGVAVAYGVAGLVSWWWVRRTLDQVPEVSPG